MYCNAVFYHVTFNGLSVLALKHSKSLYSTWINKFTNGIKSCATAVKFYAETTLTDLKPGRKIAAISSCPNAASHF